MTTLLITSVTPDPPNPGDAILTFNAALGAQPGGAATGIFQTVDGPATLGAWTLESSTTLRINVGSDLQVGGPWTLSALAAFVTPAGLTFTLPASGTIS